VRSVRSAPHDPCLPELEVEAAVRAAREGPAGAVAPELLVVHGDVGFASATL
jgi:hypothetical protein